MNLKQAGAALALSIGEVIAFAGQPSVEELAERRKVEFDKILASREVFVDPAELLDLIYNNVAAVRLLDVRDEAEFNLFHLVDSVNVSLDRLQDSAWLAKLPKGTLIMLISNDEAAAEKGWRLLKAQRLANLYIIEGGVNRWLALYGRPTSPTVSVAQ